MLASVSNARRIVMIVASGILALVCAVLVWMVVNGLIPHS